MTLALAGALDDAAYNNNGAASAGAVVYGAGNLVWTSDLGIGAVVTMTASVDRGKIPIPATRMCWRW